jgi:hypothetical protein
MLVQLSSVFLAGVLGIPQAKPFATLPAGPVFSNPLEITHPFFPFPDPDVHLLKVMQGSDGTLEVHEYGPGTRTFQWAGQAIETREFFEWEFFFGGLLEVSANYFAQADDGTVYDFGEVVQMVSTSGGYELSWLVGGATLPGDPRLTLVAEAPAVFMPAHPEVGVTWKPEDLAPWIEEQAQVLETDVTLDMPFGELEGCLMVMLGSEPGDEHVKYYAPGMGEVLEHNRDEVIELVAAPVLP